jgi:hypothetical protein
VGLREWRDREMRPRERCREEDLTSVRSGFPANRGESQGTSAELEDAISGVAE